jgi:hypothetical protein
VAPMKFALNASTNVSFYGERYFSGFGHHPRGSFFGILAFLLFGTLCLIFFSDTFTRGFPTNSPETAESANSI